MKTVSDHFAAHFSSVAGMSDGAYDSALLDRIGDDLRQHFDASIEAEMPRGLLDLAERIDARRMGARRDD